MEEKTKYILIGIVIGIIIGIALFYSLLNFRIIGSFWGRGFVRPENLTNFTRPLRGGLV